MAGKVSVHEDRRDDDLAILRKIITLPNGLSFMTPTKSIKKAKERVSLHQHLVVNEITRRIDDSVLSSLEAGAASRRERDIKNEFLSKKLNLTIFNLTFDQKPQTESIRTLAQHLYACSESIIVIPTVRLSLLKEKNERSYSESRLAELLSMLRQIVSEIEVVGNSKPLMGTIPLLPIKYARPILEFYRSLGLNSYAIDANTKDIFLHLTDLRTILSEINEHCPLSESFIYGCNLGYPRYEGEMTRADDFLSIFAYIDIMGCTFKIRGLYPSYVQPKLKRFDSDEYSYSVTRSRLRSRALLEHLNQTDQLGEAHKVRDSIGEERMRDYVQTKKAVDRLTLERLESIATRIKVT
jgi:hypothetical protein